MFYVVTGLAQGFHIGYQHQLASHTSASANMPSAIESPGPVHQYLKTECAAGRVAGPFEQKEVPNVHISRFGVIPKKGQPGEWRLILDLSFPPGKSINDGIEKELRSLQFPIIDQAVEHILQLKPRALLAKVDIVHAFRNIPVHPDDRHLLGMKWDGKVFIDLTLPFGLRSSPRIFTTVADVFEWILLHRGVSWCLHYIDDFLTSGEPDTAECSVNLRLILAICKWLRLPLKVLKIEGPSPVLPFLGIILDTLKQEIRLPADKLDHLKSLISAWKFRKACRKRELLSLVGKLSHACKVVCAGRVFLRRMITLASKARNINHWVRLNAEFQADLAWWEIFLLLWNAQSMMDVHNPKLTPNVVFCSDASGSWGCGANWGNEWLQHPWDNEWTQQHIAAKELLPIAFACATWGPQWQHKHVLVWCDNLSVVHVIKAQSSKDPTLMHLLRCIHFFCALHDFKLRAEHIPGRHNVIADSISRNNLQVFFKEVPSAHPQPASLPPPLVLFLMQEQQDWQSPTWRQWLKASSSTAWQQALGGRTQLDSQSSCDFASN